MKIEKKLKLKKNSNNNQKKRSKNLLKHLNCVKFSNSFNKYIFIFIYLYNILVSIFCIDVKKVYITEKNLYKMNQFISSDMLNLMVDYSSHCPSRRL